MLSMSASKTEAIIVWDIENNRVPTQLVPRCFEIVQWLLQDVQENCPNSTVMRVYVAGTFDKYPSQLKNALCTHPRVQLLYSIGKVAKGGEADDALKRVMLDFHTTQLVAQKQALIVLLSGDADYNDVVDAARIAGHKVHLYHSHAVAQTLQGNVDHHEAWQTFLARKSGKSVQDLEDSGFALRMASPAASRSSGSPGLHRRVPHSHPGVKPVAPYSQSAPTRHQATSSHQHRSQTHAHSDTDSAMQPGPRPGRTLAITRPAPKHEATPRLSPHLSGQLTAKPAALYVAESEAQADAESGQDKPLSKAQSALQSGLQSGSMFPESQAESLEQPSQAPQDSGESDPPQAPSRASRGSRQPHMVSLRQSSASQSATRQLVTSRHNRRQDGASTSASPEYPPGLANPNSNGRTVVVSGFKKGMAGPEARQQTLDLCAQFGEVSCCWLRKGKSSCWFTIVQFAEPPSHQACYKQSLDANS